jgi:hypothetical protein
MLIFVVGFMVYHSVSETELHSDSYIESSASTIELKVGETGKLIQYINIFYVQPSSNNYRSDVTSNYDILRFSYDEKIVSVFKDGVTSIQGNNPGKTTVKVSFGKMTCQFDIIVK